MKKDLLTLRDLGPGDLEKIFALATRLKLERETIDYRPLAGKSIGLIFAKSSTRTRVSFEVGVHELGGYPLYLEQSKLQIGRGESVHDTAKILSSYLHGIVIRTFSHAGVEELAREASIPVVNALTDSYHPCQILADLLTVKEHSGDLKRKMVFVGDGASNIANSLILGSKLCDLELVIAAPKQYAPDPAILAEVPKVQYTENVNDAVKGADYLYTDVWVSMGFEEEKAERIKTLQPYQVNDALLAQAGKQVKVLHCLPAHRGEEITDSVMDSPASIVFDEAANRLPIHKAVLGMLFDRK